MECLQIRLALKLEPAFKKRMADVFKCGWLGPSNADGWGLQKSADA
jgi:hypothetical protein